MADEGTCFVPTTNLKPAVGDKVTVVLMLVDRTPVARETGTVQSTDYDVSSARVGFTLRLLPRGAMEARNPMTPRALATAYPPEIRRASNEFDNPLQGLETNMLTLFIDFSLSEQAADSITLDEIPSLADGIFQDAKAAEAPLPEPSPDESWQEPQLHAPEAPAELPVLEPAEPVGAAPLPRRRRRRVAVSAVAAGALCGVALALGVTRLSSRPEPVVAIAPPPAPVPLAPVRVVLPVDAGRVIDAGRRVVDSRPAVRVDAGTDPGCRVNVLSRPSGAQIVLGEEIKGQTPSVIDVPCGPVEMFVKRARYQDARLTFEARLGAEVIQNVVLQRPIVELTVTSDPAGAEVVTRGKVRGLTPVTLTVPGFEGVDIEVKYPGRPAWKKQLRLTPPTATLHAPLK